MKIAQIITRMDWEGAPTVVRTLCERLDSRYRVTLITGRNRHLTEKTKKFLDGFEGRVLVVPHLRRNINPVCDIIALVNLFLILRRERFDLVHTHTSKAGMVGRIAAYLAGVPAIIHTPHGSNLTGYCGPTASRIVRVLERRISRKTHRIFALSELEKKEYEENGIRPIGAIDVVPIGPDFEDIDLAAPAPGATFNDSDPLIADPSSRVVGTACRLEARKAPEYFVRAAALVAKKYDDVRFVVAGEGSLRAPLEAESESLGLRNRLTFLGWRENVLSVTAGFDVFVLTSLGEGVPLALLEAQALGVPVVAASVGGVPYAVRDGETGILVPPRDPGATADAVCSLLGNDAKRKAFGEAGRKWVREAFSPEAMVKETQRIYDEAGAG